MRGWRAGGEMKAERSEKRRGQASPQRLARSEDGPALKHMEALEAQKEEDEQK